MADQRDHGISWTDETWNPIRGCRRVNTDCINCYAERLAATRLKNSPKYLGLAEMTDGGPRWTGAVSLDEDSLLKPLAWQRPRMVFTNAMSDLFYEELPFTEIDRIVAVMALAVEHTFQVLTKRPARMAEYLTYRADPYYIQEAMNKVPGHRHTLAWPIQNIWWGASMGHQKAALEMLPHLASCRPHAKVLWVSAEPLTEEVDLVEYLPYLDWVVGGGESGPTARRAPLYAFRKLLADCTLMGVPYHHKQNGEWLHESQFEAAGIVTAGSQWYRDAFGYWHVGKRMAGRLLDGVTHNAFPRLVAR